MKNGKKNKITRKYRIAPDLVAKMQHHAGRWHLTETSIVEHAVRDFLAVKRIGLFRP